MRRSVCCEKRRSTADKSDQMAVQNSAKHMELIATRGIEYEEEWNEI